MDLKYSVIIWKVLPKRNQVF